MNEDMVECTSCSRKATKHLKNKLKKFLTKTSEYDKIKKLCHKKRTTQNLDN